MSPYTPKDWANGPDGGTPILDTDLERMETQYAQAVADSAVAGAGTFVGKKTKRAAFTWGCGGSQGAATTPLRNVNLRKQVRLPVTTTRWRLKVANYDFMREVAAGAGLSVRAVYVGKHLTNDTVGTGKFVSTPTLAIADPNGAVPGDGSYFTSAWVTAPAAQITANEEHLISFDLTAPADVQAFRTNVHDWVVFAVGQAGAANPTPAPSNTSTTYLDTYIEYEFTDDGRHPVGLFVGDSITEGQAGGLNTRSYPIQFAGLTGAVAITAGCSGITAAYMVSPTDPLWTKLDLPNYSLDFAVVLLGTNDANTSVTLANYQASMLAIVANLRAWGIKRIILGVIPPRSGITAGDAQDLLRQSYRTWLTNLPMGVQGIADFDTVLRNPANTLQIRPDWTVDGIHPIGAGYARMAKELGSLWTTPVG